MNSDALKAILVLGGFLASILGYVFIDLKLKKIKYKNNILRILKGIAPDLRIPEFKFKDEKADKEIQKLIEAEIYYSHYDSLPKDIKDIIELLKVQYYTRKNFKDLLEKNKHSYLTWDDILEGLGLCYGRLLLDPNRFEQIKMREKAQISANKFWRIAFGLWKRNFNQWFLESRNDYEAGAGVVSQKMKEMDEVLSIMPEIMILKFNRSYISISITRFLERRVEFLAHALKNNLHLYPYRYNLAIELRELMSDKLHYIKPEQLGLNMQLINDCCSAQFLVSLIDYRSIKKS